jgi:hypothetical protein
MKSLVYLILTLLIGCNNLKHDKLESGKIQSNNAAKAATTKGDSNSTIYWTGAINSTIPIVLEYTIEDSLIVGSITYTNTKDKKPIKIVGNIETDKSLRLLEFDPAGNITGIISGNSTETEFKGDWFSPKTRKELSCNLTKKDTTLPTKNLQTDFSNIFGEYHYQFSKAGYQGTFQINRLPDNKISFGILSVTGEPARNIAQIETDTIELTKNEFMYSPSNTGDCEFKVKFYDGFVYIKYTNGYCTGYFGNNATVDGIFFKIK